LPAWITSAEVQKYALVKWDSLNYAAGTPFTNEAAFDTFLDGTLIPRAQAHINQYCRRDFNVDYPTAVPDAIKDIAARATANMIQYMVMNKMGPLVHQGQFTLSIPVQNVLPPDLQQLLAPWEKRKPHTKASAYQTDNIKDAWGET
jgi:hypothetical protein